MLPYPDINPVAVRLGPIAIRWYSLAYIAGILLGWWVIAKEHAKRPIPNLTPKALDDMVMWAVIGIVGGGRLGYVLFYKPDYYFAHPMEILRVWEGGMSFHGGLIGVTLAFFLFCRKYRIGFFSLVDVLACAVPIGLFFGRIANFINGELYGRPTDVPWAMVFPRGGPIPRHPSELYEAGMEGVILFCVMMFLLKRTRAREKPGLLTGVFIAGYAVSRIIGECFREPDAFLGFFWGGVTMGQILSAPMFLLGLYLIFRACRSKTS
ncbi:MAG: prolipoprotein diacylglyceryl transferase [Pseudomonadota bacterium]|nr:prolipoprotein diacylglyceryl transferase [Pseudomonadota bacterium]